MRGRETGLTQGTTVPLKIIFTTSYTGDVSWRPPRSTCHQFRASEVTLDCIPETLKSLLYFAESRYPYPSRHDIIFRHNFLALSVVLVVTTASWSFYWSGRVITPQIPLILLLRSADDTTFRADCMFFYICICSVYFHPI